MDKTHLEQNSVNKLKYIIRRRTNKLITSFIKRLRKQCLFLT